MNLRVLASFFVLVSTLSCSHLNGKKSQDLQTSTAAPASSSPTATPSPTPPQESSIHPRGLDFSATIKLVTFSSSANQYLPQPLWTTMMGLNPDIFLFIGNTILATPPANTPTFQQFRRLNRIPEFRAFREKIPFLVTWDDKDYGAENGGGDFANKETAKTNFLRNWTYIRDSIGMGQSGIYHTKIIGPKNKQVQFIVLDTRSFRSPLKKEVDSTSGEEKVIANQDSKDTLLGMDQWQWLEEQLKRPAQVRFIISSLPLISGENNLVLPNEQWANFPKEKQRFFDLLKKTQVKNLVVLSGGNRRQGSIAKTVVKDWGPLFDVTAGPITEARETAIKDPSFEGDPITVENFGVAQIDWTAKAIQVEIRDSSNKTLSGIKIKIK